jgi:DNA repair protein RecO (recombination protein O)
MAAPITGNGSKQQVESAAIVLDCRDHGESDKIITFFCKKLGRITGIAKGAKRSKKRFVNKLEIFSSLLITHTLPQDGRLAFIAEAELLDGFLTLRKDFPCYATASVIQEVILLATKDMESDDEVYPLLLWSFRNLANQRHPVSVLIFFLIRFYAIIGYCPILANCHSCGKKLIENESYSFYPQNGCIHCKKCNRGHKSTRIQLSCGTLRSLDMALKQPIERLQRLKFTEQSRQESLSFLHFYGRQLFQREIISWAIMDIATNRP